MLSGRDGKGLVGLVFRKGWVIYVNELEVGSMEEGEE